MKKKLVLEISPEQRQLIVNHANAILQGAMIIIDKYQVKNDDYKYINDPITNFNKFLDKITK